MALMQSGHKSQIEICKALGLNPGMTKDFSIHFPAKGIATVKAEIYLSDDQADMIAPIVKEFELHEKAEKDS